MRVHIFQTADCEEGVLSDVVNLLGTFSGPLRFIAEPEIAFFDRFGSQPEDPFFKTKVKSSLFSESSDSKKFVDRFQGREGVDWDEIFQKCKELRVQHDIASDAFVILLMAANNSFNWFAAGSRDDNRDLFVHTEDWDFFVGSDRRFPIAYQIVSGVLKKLVFRDYDDLTAHWHEEPRGCMLDFCENKVQIALKVRTGDACPDCMNLFISRKVRSDVLTQVFRVLDGIRGHMQFKSRFQLDNHIPALHIVGQTQNLVFPALGNLSIHLDPLEKAIYIFFLRHPEGVLLNQLPDYRNEIFQIYSGLSSSDSLQTMEQRVADLVNPLSNTCNEKLSKIKSKIVGALGEELARHFTISGPRAEAKKISFDRSLLLVE